MRRHFLIALFLWIILAVAGEIVALRANIYPVVAAQEARIIDEAFRYLMVLGVPVFTFVLATLAYSVLRFRGRGVTEEGPPIQGHTGVAVAWLVITGFLAVYVIFNPGLKGLAELRARSGADDLVVQVEAEQWNWSITYPQYDVSIRKAKELPLPVGRRVRVELTANDVLHSFWIPAFRMKADAVPGLVTTLYVTPDREGDFDSDFNYRVQCAELCGTGHARMRMAVQVISPADFEARMAELQAKAPQARSGQ